MQPSVSGMCAPLRPIVTGRPGRATCLERASIRFGKGICRPRAVRLPPGADSLTPFRVDGRGLSDPTEPQLRYSHARPGLTAAGA